MSIICSTIITLLPITWPTFQLLINSWKLKKKLRCLFFNERKIRKIKKQSRNKKWINLKSWILFFRLVKITKNLISICCILNTFKKKIKNCYMTVKIITLGFRGSWLKFLTTTKYLKAAGFWSINYLTAIVQLYRKTDVTKQFMIFIYLQLLVYLKQ